MAAARVSSLREFLPEVAPGTDLREGLERVLRAHMGALVVIGDGPEVLGICTGGFHFDAEMTPQRLSEVGKMDGAIVLNRSSTRIAWANVHLVPDATVPTRETGTRHRTAERVARSIGVVVISVSEEMGTITLFFNEERLQLESADVLANRSNQLLAVLDRFKSRFDEVLAGLSASEIQDVVTVREVALVIQRAEMVLRVSKVITELLNSLGRRGTLVRLQRDELVAGVSDEQRYAVEDYFFGLATNNGLLEGQSDAVSRSLDRLVALSANDLLELPAVVMAVAPDGSMTDLDASIEAHGVRLVRRIPQVSPQVAERLIANFGDLHSLVRAPIDALIAATGMEEPEARALKAGMMRFAESSILDRLN